ncbi:TPA: DUF2730 domain-containing protein [Klebsiella michiganensis]
MDPITLSTVASVLLKAGPSLVRTVGGWFGSDTSRAADSVASIVETVNGAINPADQQRVLEQKLAQLPPEQLVQLETLKVQLQQFQLERDKAQMADQQAAQHEQQETIRNGDNWAIIWALFMSAVNVIQLLLAKTYVKREELELLRTRLQGIENTIAGLPSQKDLHQLQLEMSNLRGDLRELGPAIRQVKHVSDLLLENELKEK